MKKLFLAALMALAMASPAFAAPEAFSVDVNNALNNNASASQQERGNSRQMWRERGDKQCCPNKGKEASSQSPSQCMDSCNSRQCMKRCMQMAGRQNCQNNENCSRMMKAKGEGMGKHKQMMKKKMQEGAEGQSE